MAKVKARNLVIDGEYICKFLICSSIIMIRVSLFKNVKLTKDIVESYEVMDQQPMDDIYVVLIKYKDGKKSLIEMDGKHFAVIKRSLGYNVEL